MALLSLPKTIEIVSKSSQYESLLEKTFQSLEDTGIADTLGLSGYHFKVSYCPRHTASLPEVPLQQDYVKAILETFYEEWLFTSRQFEAYRGFPSYKTEQVAQFYLDAPFPAFINESIVEQEGMFESISDLFKSDVEPDELDLAYNLEAQFDNAKVPKYSLIEMFGYSLQLSKEISSNLSIQMPEDFFQQSGSRIFMVNFNSLTFATPPTEKLWIILSIHDYIREELLTENISFPFGNDPVKIAFPIYSKSRSVVLIARLERPFDGDIAAGAEKYVAKKTPNPSPQQVKNSYRQPLAWGYFPLSDEEFGKDGNEIRMPFFRCESGRVHDKELYGTIGIFEKSSTSRKLKTLSITATLKFSKIKHLDEVGISPEQRRWIYATSLAKDYSVLSFPRYENFIYIYPITVNLSRGVDARNITCKVKIINIGDAHGDPKELKMIYTASVGGIGYSEEACTSIDYHNKAPQFYSEIKARLPISLSPDQFLILTFSHISCKANEERLAGYSTLRLQNAFKRLLDDGFYELPITPEPVFEEINLEDKKMTCSIRIKCISSLFPQDDKLHSFLSLHENREIPEEEILNKIEYLKDVQVEKLVQFFTPIMDLLMNLLIHPFYNEIVGKRIFKSICYLISTVESFVSDKDINIINFYSKCKFRHQLGKNKNLGDIILRNWVNVLKETSGDDSLVIFKSCSFFFPIILRCNILFFSNENGTVAYNKELMENTNELVRLFAQEVQKKSVSALTYCRMLCECLAGYLSDSFLFYNVHQVETLLTLFLESFSSTSSETILDIMLDFLKIICGSEQYIFSKANLGKLTLRKSEQKGHFMSGLLIENVFKVLSHSSDTLRTQSLRLLFDVVAKHINSVHLEGQGRLDIVASYYIPFISKIFQFPGFLDSSKENHLTPKEKRICVIIILGILQNLNEKTFKDWVKTSEVFAGMFQLLCTSMGLFTEENHEKFKNWFSGADANKETKKALEDIYRKNKAVTFRDRKMNTRASKTEIKSTWETLGNRRVSVHSYNGSSLSNEITLKIENLIIQDVYVELMGIWETLTNISCDETTLFPSSFGKSVEFLEKYLSSPQTEITFYSIGKSLLVMLPKIKSHVFVPGNIFCSSLIRQLLKFHCFANPSIRSHSTGIHYYLTRMNYENSKKSISITYKATLSNFDKMVITSGNYFRKSISDLLRYAEKDIKANHKFKEEIRNLISTLQQAWSTKSIIQTSHLDLDSLIESKMKLADAYKNVPELRVAWFRSMAGDHEKENNFVEAAYCHFYASIIGAEYLRLNCKEESRKPVYDLYNKPELNYSKEEKNLLQSAYSYHDDKCIGDEFTESGVVLSIEQASHYFRKALLYEISTCVLKESIPILELESKYESLSINHGLLGEIYKELAKVSESGKRVLCTFFRVKFLGKEFGRMNQKEFIYREKSLVTLSDMCLKLKNYYGEMYQHEINIVPDAYVSTPANDSEMGILVTYVEPLKEGKLLTYFEKMTFVDTFCYETPFTKTGKAHGSISEQYLRRSILKVERPLPWLRKRSLVIEISEEELNPVEVSIGTLSKQCDKFDSVLRKEPIALKELQLLLQGSVRATVNAGPLEIAKTFLKVEGLPSFVTMEHQTKLRKLFVTLLVLCQEALQVSKGKISPDQLKYQEDLEMAFQELKSELNNYM